MTLDNTTDHCIHTAAGFVEAEVSGSGAPIVVFHGSPGGIDAARAMSRFLDKDKFKVICFSRPGYLNTPLPPDRRSIDDEADLIAALLDALQIARVGVLTWSGGGAAAYRLAVRHPHRVSSVVAIAALSSSWIAPKEGIIEHIISGTKIGELLIRFASSHWPEHVIEGALEKEGSLTDKELHDLAGHVTADPDQRQLVLDIALTVNVGGRRKAGWQNDVRNFAAINSLELEKVQCPVLLVHGDGDTDAPVVYSESAHGRLLNSLLVTMPKGTHLSFYADPQAREVQERARVWLLNHGEGCQ